MSRELSLLKLTKGGFAPHNQGLNLKNLLPTQLEDLVIATAHHYLLTRDIDDAALACIEYCSDNFQRVIHWSDAQAIVRLCQIAEEVANKTAA